MLFVLLKRLDHKTEFMARQLLLIRPDGQITLGVALGGSQIVSPLNRQA